MEAELTPLRLGELLRRAREARTLSISQVERETRIRRSYLESLERDDLTGLPPPVFTRGLVRAYARYLGIEPAEAEELLNKLENRTESVGVQPTVDATQRPARSSGQPAQALSMLLIGLVVGTGAYLAWPRVQERIQGVELVGNGVATSSVLIEPSPTALVLAEPIVPTVAPATPTPAPTVTTAPSATLAPEQRGTATAAAAMRGIVVEARVTGRVWLQAESDGRVAFAGILMPGDKKTWRGERRVSLYVGDAGRVQVTQNGQLLGTIGPPGEVVKREWTETR